MRKIHKIEICVAHGEVETADCKIQAPFSMRRDMGAKQTLALIVQI